jgi:hypothetical protein
VGLASDLPEYDEIMDRYGFRELPRGHQERILRERKRDRDPWFALGESELALRRRVFCEGWMVFTLFYGLAARFGAGTLVTAPLVGAIVGVLW